MVGPAGDEDNEMNQSDANINNELGRNNIDDNETINFRFALTNARSLWAKIESLYDYFDELELDIAIVTETWFYDCAALDRLMCNATHGRGVSSINYCRKRRGRLNIGGGVSIMFKTSKARATEYKFKRAGHEVVAARIKLTNNKRPLFVLAIYASTRLKKAKANELLGLVNDAVHKIKSTNEKPYIVVAGDFNCWPHGRAFEDFEDIRVIQTPPTRGDATLDIAATNFNAHLKKTTIMPPLRNDISETDSDHRVAIYEFKLEHCHEFKKIVYWSRDMRGEKKCIEAINRWKWHLPPIEVDPDQYVGAFHEKLLRIMDEHIPLRRKTKKSTDLPWYNERARKRGKQRRAVFRSQGRSRDWHELKDIGEDVLERSKKKFYDKTVEHLTTKNNNVAYGAVKMLKEVNAPSSWQPTQMRPELTVEQLGEEMADFYATISREFEPVKPDDAPRTYDKERSELDENAVKKEIRSMVLPKSYVTYDPPPSIVKPCAETFAKILTPVLNQIGKDGWWPERWKNEEVTVIPKKQHPESFDQCRNISCTSVFSKIAESFMIREIREEITLSKNQYGGKIGTGTAHLLCDLTTSIMEQLEEPDRVVSLMAVDFAKAFNRMSHSVCLREMARLGASTQTIQKAFGFLRERKMQIRQGHKLSTPRSTPGGAPQGTKSGNLLFSIATDHIGGGPVIERAAAARRVAENDDRRAVVRDLEASLNTHYYDLRERRGVRRLEDTMHEEDWDRDEIEAALQIDYEWSELQEFKYVDDLTVLETMPSTAGIATVTTRKEEREIQAQGLQEQLERLGRQAADIGMELHPGKTQLLCISSAIHSNINTFIRTGDAGRIESAPTMKILGYHLGKRPNADAHMQSIKTNFMRNCWMLHHLRRARINSRHMTKIYCSMIRSAMEYSSVIYGGFLTQQQSDELERLQATSLHIIWGWDMSYQKVLTVSGLETMEARRKKAFEKFTMKAYKDRRYREAWFPLRPPDQHSLRTRRPFQEEAAGHERLRNTPVHRMRRLLNDKVAAGEVRIVEE